VLGITLCLPFTFGMHNASAISLLLGVYAGSVYGGCISAILINAPGTPASAATTFDGFTLAQKGFSEKALGWATLGSVFGGMFSCAVLVMCAPQLASVAMRFGPPETCCLIFMGLTCICTVSQGDIFKGILSGMIGLFVASVGQDTMTGDERFTFGFFPLTSGFELIAVLVGVFALSEVFQRVDIVIREHITNIIKCTGLRLPSLRELDKSRLLLLLKSSCIGSFIGILPGSGTSAAVFLSYGEAKRSSPRRENFGKGEPDGIIAPEAANNAVTGGALVPSLALGLPGDAVTAVMLATLIIHGITPGVRLMQDSPDIVYSMFLSLSVANLLIIPFGWLASKGFSYMLKLPESILLPIITLLCLLGSFGVRNSMVDLWTCVIMGAFGLFMRYFKMPPAPLVIGLVLGPMFELSLRQTYLLKQGKMIRTLTEHPIALFLFIVAVLMLGFPMLRGLWKNVCNNITTLTEADKV
jgi:putative tricarboxylic transport membrane protein